MQLLSNMYQPLRSINSRVRIGGGVLGLMMLGEVAFAYGSGLV